MLLNYKHVIKVFGVFFGKLFPKSHVSQHPANMQLSVCKGAVQDFIRGDKKTAQLNFHESFIEAKPCDEALALIQLPTLGLHKSQWIPSQNK